MARDKQFGKSRYTKVYDHIWDDERIKPLSDNAKLLFFFLATCKHGNALGAYVLPMSYLEGDIGWSKERTKKPFKELLDGGLIHYDQATNLIVITGHLKFNPIENQNQTTAAVGIAETLPKSQGFSAIIETLTKTYHKPLRQLLNKRLPEPEAVTEAETVTEPEEETEKKTKYLECIFLTKEEHDKLSKLFMVSLDTKLQALNEGIMSKGYKYKSHYHTILSWARRDGWNGEAEVYIDRSIY